MKRIVGLMMFAVLILVGCAGNQTTEEQVTELVQKYVEALKVNDTAKLVKYSDDVRFPDKKQQKEEYLSIEQDITDAKMMSVNQVTDTEFETTLEITADGESNQLEFLVEKQTSGWKVIVGQDY